MMTGKCPRCGMDLILATERDLARQRDEARANLTAAESKWEALRAYLKEARAACVRLQDKWEERGNDTEVYAFKCRETEVIEALTEMDRLDREGA